MLKLPIPQLGDETLFEATLEPTASAVDKMMKSKDIGEGEIIGVRGKKNTVSVGARYYENLISRFSEQKEEIPHEIKGMMADYDFHLVNLSCSFLPDRDCRFVWVRFGVELSARSESGEPHEEKPIAWDMFPDEVNSEIKYKRESNIAPGLKFNFSVVNADIKLIDFKTSKELIVYEPQITAYDINTPKPKWDFESTKEKEMRGNKKDLILIVKAPKNSKVKGRFLFNTEIECKIAKWIPIPLTVRKDKVTDAEYDLSK